MKSNLFINIVVFSLIFVLSGCGKEEPLPGTSFINLDEEVNHIGEKYVKVGLIIGIIDNQQKRHVYSFGSRAVEEEIPPDVNTTFDIGSSTKTFTATLFTNMYLTGNFVDDTVSHYLPG
jgi:CubicO group peptidase (beta-lactamase class C family)